MAESIIQNPSITTNAFEYDEVGRVSAIAGHPLAGEGGGTIEKSDLMWKPTVADDGFVRWTLESSATTPDAAYISGAQGPAGENGTSIVLQSVTDVEGGKQVTLAWGETPSTSSFVIPSGTNGKDGKDGTNGTSVYLDNVSTVAGGTQVTLGWGTSDTSAFVIPSGASGTNGSDGYSPTVTTTDIPISTEHPQGGTSVTITDKTGDHQFNVWNGINGEGATVNLLDGNGIHIDQNGTSYTISVSADYSGAATAWVDDKNYLTNSDLTNYATKAYVEAASANAYNEAVAQIPDVTNFITKDADNLTYYYKKTETSAASALATEFAKYVIKPDSSLVNNYLVLRTDNAGNVSGWCDFNDQCYSKGESDRTFVATANIDTTTLSGNGKSSSTKLGVNTSAIPTKDWLDDNYLPLSGGIVSGSTYFSAANGQNMIAVASAATLIGASRQTSANFGINNTAIGTTWVGVNGDGSNRGFLKYINGGNVGDLNGQGVQVEFGGGNGGEMLLKTSTSDPNTTTKVVNVPQSGYNSMIDFDATNGPNYMLRKLSDGRFDIGACVINVTSIPTATEPNTYYFVYDIV